MGQPIRPLIERILHGRLIDILVDYRRKGLSYERIARQFGHDHAIEVTGEQVRKWCKESGIDAIVEPAGDAA